MSGAHALNILFVPGTHSDQDRLDLLAGALNGLGHACIRTGSFPNGLGPDLIHAWPDIDLGADLGLDKAAEDVHCACPRVVHIERPFAARSLPLADGYTCASPLLLHRVPPGKPSLELWPAADPRLYFPRPVPRADGRVFGISPHATVLVYTGNAHYGNAHRIRSLYLAIAILNRANLPAVLVRTGVDSCPLLGPDPSWGRGLSIELGMVDRGELPAILSLADILVIPGEPVDSTSVCFPRKLSEFLTAGRPVVLPRYDFTRGMRHGQDAWLLEKADGRSIAGAVATIQSDPALYTRLAEGALAFSESRLHVRQSAEKLAAFYRSLTPGTSRGPSLP